MKLHGYCEDCHKVKLVRVTSSVMSTWAAKGGTGAIVGTCDDCTDTAELRHLSDRQLLHKLNGLGGRGRNKYRDEARRRNLI